MALATRQSEKSRQTDLKVSLSAAKAVREVGVDQMALTRVAADAGYSSGAIYARCDDRSELIVMSWEKCFWPMLLSVLEPVLDAVLDCNPAALDGISARIAELSSPEATPDLGSAMEVIAASRRDEVIGEVVQRDFNELMTSRGVGPGTEGVDRQIAVAAVASLFGASFINSAYSPHSHGPIDPAELISQMADASRRPTAPVAASKAAAAKAAPFERPTTLDDARDALLEATEYVIARSGVHKATISRIARRAGVSVGAIYGLYDNKDSLVKDCVEVLFPPQTRRDVANWSALFTADDPRLAVSSILRTHMAPENAQWRRFRLECLVSARHSPGLARQLGTYAEFARNTLVSAMERRTSPGLLPNDTSLSARASIAGLALVEVVDPSVASLDWRWIPIR
ncbi:MAG: TetR/AcrR family transcriptional regulator [Ilumatobacteraceae bacterium]